jgi:hypothetical protein
MIWIRTRPKNPKTLPYGASYNAATVGDHRAAVLMSGLRHHLSRPRRRQPVSGFIAVQEGKIAGFACHDATCPNFFGPTPSSAVLGPQPIMQKRLARWPSKAPSPVFIAACSSDAGPPSLLRSFGATPAARALHRGSPRRSPRRLAGHTEMKMSNIASPCPDASKTACRESALQTTDELPPSTLRAVPVT